MAYTQADADVAARQVKEARENIARLTTNIQAARGRGQQTHRNEELLISWLISLESLLTKERAINAALAAVKPA